jgi:Bacterial Ig domain
MTVGVGALTAGFLIVASRNEGYPEREIVTQSGTHWLVHQPSGLLLLADGVSGRVMVRLDTEQPNAELHLAQGATGSFLLNDTEQQISHIDEAEVQLETGRDLPANFTADATEATLTTSSIGVSADGMVIAPAAGAQGFVVPNTGEIRSFAVASDRRMSTISADGSVWSILGTGEIERVLGSTRELFATGSSPDDLELTVVGDQAAVLSRASGAMTWYPSGNSVAVPNSWQAADAVVQNPGEASSCVWLGLVDQLLCLSPDGVTSEVRLSDVQLSRADQLAASTRTIVVMRANGSLLSIDPTTGATLPLPYKAAVATTTATTDSSGAVWIDDPQADSALVVSGQTFHVVDKLDSRAPTFSPTGAPTVGSGSGTGDGGNGSDGDGPVPGDEIGGAPRVSAGIEPDNDALEEPPIAVDDEISGQTNQQVRIVVTANDYDPDGGAIFVKSTTEPEHGALAVINSSTVTYQPTDDYSGTDSFSYTIADETGFEASAQVSITVLPVGTPNQSPTARGDVRETSHARAVIVDVLANDTDPEQAPLSIGEVVAPNGNVGSVEQVQLGDGRAAIRFTPADDYPGGVAQFSYRAVDVNDALSNSAIVSIQVAAAADANRAPIALGDAAVTRPTTPVEIPVLANDRDPDNDDLIIERIDLDPRLGSARIAGGAIVFEPKAATTGTVTFYYVIADRFGETATAEVLVQILEVAKANGAPSALDNRFDVFGNEATLDVVSDDVDPDGDVLQIIRVTQPDVGEIVSNDGRVVRYRPDTTSRATQTQFDYVISDSNGHTAQATVFISLRAPADAGAPTATADAFQTLKNTAKTVNLLANDTDPARTTLTVIGSPACAHGNCTITSNGELTYTPDADFVGVDSFVYRIRNAAGVPATGNVTVTVIDTLGQNFAPVASPDRTSVRAGAEVEIDVLGNDSDPENDALSILSVSSPTDGSAADLSSDGRSVVFRARNAPRTTSNFSYVITDENGATATGQVSVQITDNEIARLAPIAISDSGSLVAGESRDFDVLANDIDEDGQPNELRIESVRLVTGDAEVSPTTNERVRVRPNAGFIGDLRISYTVIDIDGLKTNGTLIVTVTEPVNGAPIVADDTANTTSGQAITIAVLGNDNDPDGDAFVAQIVSSPPATAGAAEVIGEGRQIRFTPQAEFDGTTRFTYQAVDARGKVSEPATVTVTVLACAQSTPIAPDRIGEFTPFNTPLSLELLAAGQTDFTVTTQSVSGGSVTAGDRPGVVVFTPTTNSNGGGGFSYTVENGCDVRRTGRVTIDVNRAPRINVAISVETEQDRAVEVSLNTIASDDEGILLSSATTAVGSVEIINGGSAFRYTPPPGYRGSPELRITVVDAGGLTADATLRVVVNPPTNQPPVAFDDAAGTSLSPGQTATLDVLGNDQDPDGPQGDLRVMLMSSTVEINGVFAGLSVTDDGRRIVVNVPDGVQGTGSFSYRAVDAFGAQSEPAKVVVYANRQPGVVNLSVTVIDGQSAQVDAIGGGNPDPDGDRVKVAGARSDSDLVSVDEDGTVLIVTAAPGSAGTQATILFSLVDVYGAWTVSSLTVTVVAP